MKRKIFYGALALILICVAATGTLAYFTSEDTAHNVITTDGVDIVLREYQLTEEGLVAYPDGKLAVMPGGKISKVVKVENLEAESWIRAKYEVVITGSDKKVMPLTDSELKKVVNIVPTTHWTEKDGWYYCNESVKTAEETQALFTEVSFSGPEMDNSYQGCEISINVTAQAVQKANNGATALEAAGWK